MHEGLKFANRLRLDLAIEIRQLASGVRTVAQTGTGAPVDVTEHALAVAQERFAMLENLIAALVPDTASALRPAG